jgi:hypothetical protein
MLRDGVQDGTDHFAKVDTGIENLADLEEKGQLLDAVLDPGFSDLGRHSASWEA